MVKLFRLFFIVSLLIVNALKAQQGNHIISSRFISVENGLAAHQVMCGLQDNQGFLWFGTRNGLNRFDGENFLLFTSEQDSLQSNEILQLATDGSNLLFILYGDRTVDFTSYGKIDVMDLKTQKVISLSKKFTNMPFKEKDVVSFVNDASGNIMFITKSPAVLWLYNSKSGFKRSVDLNIWKDPRSVNRLVEGYINNGDVMLTKPYGEFTFFIHNDSMREIRTGSETEDILLFFYSKNQLYVTYREHDNIFGLGIVDDKGAIKRIDGSNDFDLSYLSGGLVPVVIHSSTDTCMVLLYPSGLWLYTRDDTTEIVRANDISNYSSLRINQFFFDKQGNQWLCTSNGLIEVKVKKNNFTPYFTKAQQSDEINVQARGIYEDKNGNIYADIWSHFFMESKGGIFAKGGQFLDALGTLNDSICVGGNSLWEFAPSTDKLSQLTPDGSFIWCLFQLNKDTLLLGRADKINLFEWSQKKLIEAHYSDKSFPNPACIYRFIKATDGNIWAASENGLYVLDKKGTIKDYYGDSKENGHKLPFPGAYDICEDNTGIFWLATNGQGLFRWNKNKNEFRQFTFAEGLPANVTYRIEKDNYGNLWISTDYGLTRLNSITFAMQNYTMADGLSQNEFNRESSFKAPDGKLFFGGINGINAFYPLDFVRDSGDLNAPLRIIDFTKFSNQKDKLINLTTELINKNEIELTPDDRFFNLQFMLLDYENGKKHFAYKIEGIDKDWNTIDENSIRISGLPYGEFTLHIKGRTASGAWSRNELVIPIIVYTPYYRKVWFIILCLVMLIILIYAVTWFRTKRLEAEKIRLEHIVSERTGELKQSLEKQEGMLKEKDMLMREIHHRVKNNLQSISILTEMQINREKAEKHINPSLEEIYRRISAMSLVHELLYSQNDITGLSAEKYFDELIKSLYETINTQHLNIAIVSEIDDFFIDSTTCISLGMITSEAVSNSIKYAFKGIAKPEMTIKLKLEGENVNFVVADNGIGFNKDKSTRENSLGMRLIDIFVRQMRGTYFITGERGVTYNITFKKQEWTEKPQS